MNELKLKVNRAEAKAAVKKRDGIYRRTKTCKGLYWCVDRATAKVWLSKELVAPCDMRDEFGEDDFKSRVLCAPGNRFADGQGLAYWAQIWVDQYNN